MVPHDARRLSEEDLNVFSLMGQQDPLIPKNERFDDITPATASSSSSSRLFGEDLEIKPEIDTGTVSESCFSFKKLWKYMGPGKI
jgi:natural resistance-associated macrophage protein